MTLSMKRLIFSAAACALAAAAVRAAVPAPDPDDGAIELPAGFRALVVADNLGALRFMAVTPSGDLYVKTDKEGIVALRDTNGDGRADLKETFGSGGGTGIAVRDGWLYHSTNQALSPHSRAARAQGRTGDHRLRPSRGTRALGEVVRLRRVRSALR